jgi:hypothetical protein
VTVAHSACLITWGCKLKIRIFILFKSDTAAFKFQYTRVRQKGKGLFKRSTSFFCKYTGTKLILLFNVIPLDFNAPVPEFQKFLIPSEKSLLVASLTNFAPRQ